MPVTLLRYAEVRGVIHCITGLRVGGSKDDIDIGGLDSPVIRHAITRQPYIPGSSLKGKLRSLLEYCYGLVTGTEPSNSTDWDSPVARLFGPHKQPNHQLGPSRLIIRDAPLTEGSLATLTELLEKGLEYAEMKQETMVNRMTQTATAGLRTIERVPAGAEFALSINIRLFEVDGRTDNEAQLFTWLGEALSMLQQDALGGSGTRGSGQVELRSLTLDGQPWTPPQPRCGQRAAGAR